MGIEIKCPECGSTKIGKGKLSGYAVLMPVDKFFTTGSAMIAEVCTNCGLIISFRAKNPEKFKQS